MCFLWRKDGERNSLGLELIHVRKNLIDISGLNLQEGYFGICRFLLRSDSIRKQDGTDSYTDRHLDP